MACPPELIATRVGSVVLRMSNPERQELLRLVFSRYPKDEWATFARFGWRDTGDTLLLTLASIEGPKPGDLDDGVGHVAILEPSWYTLRTALHAEAHPPYIAGSREHHNQPPLVLLMHSHPEGSPPVPSLIDDDMDAYYADYFAGFAPTEPGGRLGGPLGSLTS